MRWGGMERDRRDGGVLRSHARTLDLLPRWGKEQRRCVRERVGTRGV